MSGTAIRTERLRAVAGDAGCHACHTHMSCTERCPKQLSPTAAIAGLKREVTKAVLQRRALSFARRGAAVDRAARERRGARAVRRWSIS